MIHDHDEAPWAPQAEVIPPAEWAVAALGLILVIAAVWFLTWDGLRGRNSVPDLAFSVEQIESTPAGYLVRATVRNRQNTTIAALKIRGLLKDKSGQVQETAEAELDFLPGESKGNVGLYFRADPRQGQLMLFASGYQEP